MSPQAVGLGTAAVTSVEEGDGGNGMAKDGEKTKKQCRTSGRRIVTPRE